MKTIPDWANNSFSKLAKLASASEKHKALLDLGESFLNKLAGQVLGEYHFANLQDMKVEKELYLRENDLLSGKSVSLGHYCSLIQKAAQSLENAEKNSILKQAIVFNKRDKKTLSSCEEFTKLRDFFKGIKAYSETGSEASIENFFSEFTVDEPPLSANLVEFFLIFPQLRNRFAHPHYDIRDKKTGEVLKSVEWPLGDSYYQIANPLLEKAILKAIDLLSSLWQQPVALVSESDDENYTVLIPNGAEGQKTKIAQPARPLKSDALLNLSTENKVQFCVDFHYNLYCSEAAKKEIIAEEERKENEAIYAKNKDQLSKSITEFLEDGVIDLEEYGLLRAVAINNLDMSEESLKDLICAIAANLGIDDPFPAVDPKYLEKLDEALKAGNLNRLKLKLEGERFGVEAAKFESVLQERCELLEIDITELGISQEYTVTKQELEDVAVLTQMTQWLISLKVLNGISDKFSVYKTEKGANKVINSKEFYHQTFWDALSGILQRILKEANNKVTSKWITLENRWNAGAMVGYYWLRAYPATERKGSSTRGLNLTFSIYPGSKIEDETDLFIGLMIEHDLVEKIEKFPCYENIFKRKLLKFFEVYSAELAAYPDFQVISGDQSYKINEKDCDLKSLCNYHISLQSNKFFRMNFGQLFHLVKANPLQIFEFYQTAYSLMSKLLEEVQQDYLVQRNSFILPLLPFHNQAYQILSALNKIVKSVTALQVSEHRNLQLSAYYDEITKKNKDNINFNFEYGIWIDLNPKILLLGYRFRCAETYSRHSTAAIVKQHEVVSSFNHFISTYNIQNTSNIKVTFIKEPGFFAFHLPIKFEEYENELNVVLAELEKALQAMKENELDFLDFGK